MISQEALKKIIDERVAAKLAGDKSVAPQPPPQSPLTPDDLPASEVKPEPIVKQLDEIDVVRLENLQLKTEVEKLRREIEEERRKHAQYDINNVTMALQIFLADKYDVDTEKDNLVVDAQARTLTITPRE